MREINCLVAHSHTIRCHHVFAMHGLVDDSLLQLLEDRDGSPAEACFQLMQDALQLQHQIHVTTHELLCEGVVNSLCRASW